MGDLETGPGLAELYRRSIELLDIANEFLQHSRRQLHASERLLLESQSRLDAGVVWMRPAPGSPPG